MHVSLGQWQCLEVTKTLIEAGVDPHARNALARPDATRPCRLRVMPFSQCLYVESNFNVNLQA